MEMKGSSVPAKHGFTAESESDSESGSVPASLSSRPQPHVHEASSSRSNPPQPSEKTLADLEGMDSFAFVDEVVGSKAFPGLETQPAASAPEFAAIAPEYAAASEMYKVQYAEFLKTFTGLVSDLLPADGFRKDPLEQLKGIEASVRHMTLLRHHVRFMEAQTELGLVGGQIVAAGKDLPRVRSLVRWQADLASEVRYLLNIISEGLLPQGDQVVTSSSIHLEVFVDDSSKERYKNLEAEYLQLLKDLVGQAHKLEGLNTDPLNLLGEIRVCVDGLMLIRHKARFMVAQFELRQISHQMETPGSADMEQLLSTQCILAKESRELNAMVLIGLPALGEELAARPLAPLEQKKNPQSTQDSHWWTNDETDRFLALLKEHGWSGLDRVKYEMGGVFVSMADEKLKRRFGRVLKAARLPSNLREKVKKFDASTMDEALVVEVELEKKKEEEARKARHGKRRGFEGSSVEVRKEGGRRTTTLGEAIRIEREGQKEISNPTSQAALRIGEGVEKKISNPTQAALRIGGGVEKRQKVNGNGKKGMMGRLLSYSEAVGIECLDKLKKKDSMEKRQKEKDKEE